MVHLDSNDAILTFGMSTSQSQRRASQVITRRYDLLQQTIRATSDSSIIGHKILFPVLVVKIFTDRSSQTQTKNCSFAEIAATPVGSKTFQHG